VIRAGPLAWLPGIRIDHVYLSPELTATAARVGSFVGSDHRPVIAEVGLRAR
jgi:endonuclease/exonuclease/phosphatase (EEP) superfamily protein YafD